MTAPFVLPAPVAGTATGWHVVDFLDRTWKSPPAAGGTATIVLDQLDAGVMWNLTHSVAACTPPDPTSTTTTTMRLYLDAASPANLRDGTSAGNFDVADWPAGLVVPQSRQLIAVWSGCDNGSIATLSLQGQIMRQD